MVKCYKCGGDGKITCTQCNGKGYQVTYVSSPNYTGKQKTSKESRSTCLKCHGAKEITCTRCNGEGKS